MIIGFSCDAILIYHFKDNTQIMIARKHISASIHSYGNLLRYSVFLKSPGSCSDYACITIDVADKAKFTAKEVFKDSLIEGHSNTNIFIVHYKKDFTVTRQ